MSGKTNRIKLSWDDVDRNEQKFKWRNAHEKFEEEYIAAFVPCDNKDGFKIKYVYYATWHKWNLPEQELSKKKKTILLETIGSLAAFILAGIADRGMNSISFVAFPALLTMCMLIMELFGVVHFYFVKYLATRSAYETINRRIRVWTILNAALATITVNGCIICLILFHPTLTRVLTTLLYAMEAALSVLIFVQYRKIPTATQINDAIDHITIAEKK